MRAPITVILTMLIFLTGCHKKDVPVLSSEKAITAFLLPSSSNPGLPGNTSIVVSADSIIIRVPKGTDITHLTPTIKFNGVKISPASDRPQDFANGVQYTVTAQDGSSHTYYVAVRSLNQTKSILTFELRPSENPGLTETIKSIISNDTIIIPFGSIPLSSLRPHIIHTGVRISPDSAETESFIRPLQYVVVAEDGTTATYTVFASANASLYVGSDDGYFYCLNAASGGLRWKFATGGAIRSSSTLSNNIVFFGSNDGWLYALDAATGTLKWKKSMQAAVPSCPLISNGALYIYANPIMYALDPATGAVKWQRSTGGFYETTVFPLIANGILYFALFDGYHTVNAWDTATGNDIWGYDSGIGRVAPLVIDGTLYASDEFRKFIALNALTGAIIYTTGTVDYGTKTRLATGDGHIFLGDTHLNGFDPPTGNMIWSFASYGTTGMGYQDASGIVVGLFSTPVFYKGVIYAGNNDGLTYAVDAATGKLKWVSGNTISEHAAATIATVANDVVYAGNGDKGITAFDAESGTPKWTFLTQGLVYSGACVVDWQNNAHTSGESGNYN